MIALFIQPQLGHIDDQTTRAYLRWVVTHLSLADTFGTWHRFLESADVDGA